MEINYQLKIIKKILVILMIKMMIKKKVKIFKVTDPFYFYYIKNIYLYS